jgi:hypothetical protein
MTPDHGDQEVVLDDVLDLEVRWLGRVLRFQGKGMFV